MRIKQHFDIARLDNIQLDGVDPEDCPDFCDAYIESCDYDGKALTETEIEWLNSNHPEIAQGLAWEHLL